MLIALAVVLMICASTIEVLMKHRGWKAILLYAPFQGAAFIAASNGISQSMGIADIFANPLAAWPVWLLVIILMIVCEVTVSTLLSRLNPKA